MSNRASRRHTLQIEHLEERTLLSYSPVLSVPQSVFSVVKTSTLSVQVSATDRDRGEILTFSLVGAPAGASITSTQLSCGSGSAASGILTWTPSEDQGPANFCFTIVVTDNSSRLRTDSQAINVNTLAVGRVGNDLWIVGTSTNKGTQTNPGNDLATVSATNYSNTVSVAINGSTGNYTVPSGGHIVTKLFGGNDQLTVNETAYSRFIGAGQSFDGGTGTNTLIVNGSQNTDAFTVTANTVTLAGAGTLTYANVQSLFVNGLGGSDSFAMTGISATTATTLDGGTATDSFVGTFAAGFTGALSLASMDTATLSVTGTVTAGSVIKGTNFTNVAIGTLAGSLLAEAGSITGATINTISATGLLKLTETLALTAGVLSQATVGTVAGTVIAGAFVDCDFGVIAAGGSVTATGQGTTSGVTIGTLDGSFRAVEDSNPGSGTMSDTVIDKIGSTGDVEAGNISGMKVGTTDAGSSIVAAGQGTTTNVTIGTLGGSFSAVEDANPGSGVMSDTVIDKILSTGDVEAGNISGMKVGTTDAGSTIVAAGQGTTTNVTIGTLGGSFSAVEDANPGSGVMSDTVIDKILSTGDVEAGNISGMKVGTTDAGSSIIAAGQGTTTNVTIGTLGGSFSAVEDANPGSGVMSETVIDKILSTGDVEAGNISGMKVGTTDAGSSIIAAGQGTTTNVTIGTLGGSFRAVEDANPGSGVMSDTVIDKISETGAVAAGAISGMKVGTTDEGSSIIAAGQGTTTNVTIGTLNGSFSAVEDSNPGSGIMSDTVIDKIGSTGDVAAGAISGMSVGTTDAGSTIVAAGLGTIDDLTITIHAGTVSANVDNSPGSGTLTNATIGTLTITGVINANSANALNIATYVGTVNITTGLTNFAVGTLTGTANLIAGHFLNVTAQHAGPVVHFVEPTVTRTIAVTPHVPGGGVPDFSFYYDGTGSGNPNVVVNINAAVATFSAATANNFDLAVTTSTATNSGNGFDLAGLYSTGGAQTGIHNVVVGGNLLLGAVSADAASFLGLPTGTTGGVQLPQDTVAVAVAGNLPAASIVAKYVPSIAAHSFAGVVADVVNNTQAKVPLALGTGLIKANDTFQLFFSEAGNVAQFLVTSTGSSFDSKKMLFSDIVADNVPVTAQVTVVPSGTSAFVSSVAFSGQGASLTTAQQITSMISAIGGSIGNLYLTSSYGLANLTADSIIGNVDVPNGPIRGVVKTTVGNIGRAFTDNSGNIIGVTSFHAGSVSPQGKILTAGNLVSFVDVECGMDGVIAANGDIGVIQTVDGVAKLRTDGSLIRFGGIDVDSGGVSGHIIALGNAFGNITINGWLSGRIAVRGNAGEFGLAPFRYGILGNVTICGGVRSTGAIVSSGLIGDDKANNIPHDRYGTHLSISGPIQGIIAAGEDINFNGSDWDFFNYFFACGQNRIFENATGTNQTAIDSIFTNNGGLLDVLDPVQLNVIVQDLLALRVSNGKLVGTTA